MKTGGIFGKGSLGVIGGGVFGQQQMSGLGILGGGVFGQKPTSGLGYLTFTGEECSTSVVSACKTSCANVGSQGGNVEQCVGACCLVGGPAKAASCQTTCKSYRQDTPEWAQCIQKCQGFSPVDYSADKRVCEAQGKVFSWLEGGCVDKTTFESCPTGTVYATYPDGSKKCIAQSDVNATKCPSGTTLQKVPGGSTCVSPVKPAEPKPAPKPAPAPAPKPAPLPIRTQSPAAIAPMKASLFSSPIVLGGLVAAGIGAAILLTGDKKPKPKTSTATRRNPARRKRSR